MPTATVDSVTLGYTDSQGDGPPVLMMPYNPPHYAALLEGWGLRKAMDLWAYWADRSAASGRRTLEGAIELSWQLLPELEREATARGLNYLYNLVRSTHPRASEVTAWLAKRGFHASEDGRLLRRTTRGPR